MKKQTGIWLDLREAFIIQFNNGEGVVQRLKSPIEDYHVVGGARSKTPWGPMDVVSEKKSLERRKHQLKQYFKDILAQVDRNSELYLFGPAETKLKFRDYIEGDKSLTVTVRQTDTADNMSENQMVAQVRDFFNL